MRWSQLERLKLGRQRSQPCSLIRKTPSRHIYVATSAPKPGTTPVTTGQPWSFKHGTPWRPCKNFRPLIVQVIGKKPGTSLGAVSDTVLFSPAAPSYLKRSMAKGLWGASLVATTNSSCFNSTSSWSHMLFTCRTVRDWSGLIHPTLSYLGH